MIEIDFAKYTFIHTQFDSPTFLETHLKSKNKKTFFFKYTRKCNDAPPTSHTLDVIVTVSNLKSLLFKINVS